MTRVYLDGEVDNGRRKRENKPRSVSAIWEKASFENGKRRAHRADFHSWRRNTAQQSGVWIQRHLRARKGLLRQFQTSIDFDFRKLKASKSALNLEGERDVLCLIERNYSRDVRVISRQCLRQQVLYAAPRPSSTLLRGFSGVENGSIPYSNQVSEDSSKTKWARSGPPWTVLITSLGFCSQNALESGYLKFYTSWSVGHLN